MAASIYVAAGKGTLAGIKTALTAKADSPLTMAELGVQMGLLVVPEGKTMKDLADALRKAKGASLAAASVVLLAVAPVVEAATVVEVKKANVSLVEGRWKCLDCENIARKLRLLNHRRSCACRN
jgi:hypothetical protein